MSAPRSRSPGWLLVMGLALVVWGASLATIHRFGSDLPNWDQWDSEARLILRPYVRGELEASAFFAPHNEHRIALTRGLAFLLFLLNEQWDARVAAVANGLLRAAIAVLALSWSWRHLATRWRWPALGMIALCATAPVAWENVLGAFHSQWYFLIGLSLGAIGGMLGCPPGGRTWWVGLVCAAAALFSMASGLLAAVVAGATIVLVSRSRPAWRLHAPTLVVCGLVVAVGLWLLPHSPGGESPRVTSISEFFAAFQHHIGWPYERFGWFRRARMIVLPLLAWLPWLALLRRVVCQRDHASIAELTLFAVGAWVLLQFAVTAYARGAGAPWIASRYVDTVLVGLATNAFALTMLPAGTPATRQASRALFAAATLGVAVALLGTVVNTVHTLRHELPEQRERLARGEAATREYLATGNRAVLQAGDIPYPDVDGYIEHLDHPEIRAILPASVQPRDASVGPASRLASGLARQGGTVAFLGLALLGLAGWRNRHRAS